MCGFANHFISIWDVELREWDYKSIFIKDKEANSIKIKLQQLPPKDLWEDILSHATTAEQETSKTNE